MTVGDLKKELEDYDEGALVFVDYYACGEEQAVELETEDIFKYSTGNLHIDAAYN